MPITKNGLPIDSLELWAAHAGPKSAKHWVDGRSAKEAARAWLAGGGLDLPDEVAYALAGHHRFGPALKWQAEPEAKLPFDDFVGEPRNSDLAVDVEDAHGRYLMAVEAKADEPFGESVADALAASLDRYLSNNRSNGMKRIEQLAAALLGPRHMRDAPIKSIRYQLLTACAGAAYAAEQRGCSRALMLVQEFVTSKTSDDKRSRNGTELNTLINRLSHGAVTGLDTGSICGPFAVPGSPLFSPSIELFIGKVSRDVRAGGVTVK